MDIKHIFRFSTLLAAFSFSSLVLVGCVHVPTVQYPPFPDQSKKVEDTAKARIYLIRPEQKRDSQVALMFFGTTPGATGPRITPGQWRPAEPLLGMFPQNPTTNSNWKLIGKIGPGSYLCWEEPPHQFSLPKRLGKTNTVSFIDLTAGNVYYLRASIQGAWQPHSVVELISEGEGQALLKKCQPPDDYRQRNPK